MDLGELAVQIRGCQRCKISRLATPVPGEGSSCAKLMIIGVAPSDEAGRKGRPFVGATGKVLDDWLSTVGLGREAVYLTNVVKCVVPRIRNGVRQFVLDPRYQELEACREWLKLEIEVVQPKVIITLGAPALQRFFPGESISSFRKEANWKRKGNLLFFPLYHPVAWGRWGDRLRGEEAKILTDLNQFLEKLSIKG